MKKYATPAIVVVTFNTEAHTMLTISNEVSSQPQLSPKRDNDICGDWGAEEYVQSAPTPYIVSKSGPCVCTPADAGTTPPYQPARGGLLKCSTF